MHILLLALFHSTHIDNSLVSAWCVCVCVWVWVRILWCGGYAFWNKEFVFSSERVLPKSSPSHRRTLRWNLNMRVKCETNLNVHYPVDSYEHIFKETARICHCVLPERRERERERERENCKPPSPRFIMLQPVPVFVQAQHEQLEDCSAGNVVCMSCCSRRSMLAVMRVISFSKTSSTLSPVLALVST